MFFYYGENVNDVHTHTHVWSRYKLMVAQLVKTFCATAPAAGNNSDLA
jgi:hypothetical protein